MLVVISDVGPARRIELSYDDGSSDGRKSGISEIDCVRMGLITVTVTVTVAVRLVLSKSVFHLRSARLPHCGGGRNTEGSR